MKRSALKPGKPLARKTPLRSRSEMGSVGEWGRGSGGVAPPVKPVSDKRVKLNRQLAAVVAEKRRTVRYCQAQPLIKAALSHPDNTEADTKRYVEALQACHFSQPTDGHHMLKRTRGSDATLIDPDNVLLTCSPCNVGFIESCPILATRAGLLTPSFSVPRLLGRIVGSIAS